MSTLLYTSGGGRFGNQLLNYIHLFAFTIEYTGFTVITLPFIQYKDVYGLDPRISTGGGPPNLPFVLSLTLKIFRGNGWVSSHLRKHVPDWVPVYLLHAFAVAHHDCQSLIGGAPHLRVPLLGVRLPGKRQDDVDLSQSTIAEDLRSSDVAVVSGWGVRCWSLVERHERKVRERIKPKHQLLHRARKHVRSLRDQFDTLVGVHIRQGDYREWYDGRFWFDSTFYGSVMDQYLDRVDGDDVGFLITSDEEQPAGLTEGRPAYLASEIGSRGSFVDEFIMLTLCDLILAPPSTFSAVAAFVGNVPLVPIHRGILTGGWERLDRPLLDGVGHPVMGAAVK